MSRTPTRRSIADKSLTALVSFCAIAIGPIAASAMSVGAGLPPRIGPPPIGHTASPYINHLGGGLNGQVDYYGNHGGSVQPSNFSDCPRRVMDRSPKGEHGTDDSALRHRCGAP